MPSTPCVNYSLPRPPPPCPPGCKYLWWRAAWGRWGESGTSPPPCRARHKHERGGGGGGGGGGGNKCKVDRKGKRIRSMQPSLSITTIANQQSQARCVVGRRLPAGSAPPSRQHRQLLPPPLSLSLSARCLHPRRAAHRRPAACICCRTCHSSSLSISTSVLPSSAASSRTGCARRTLQRGVWQGEAGSR